MADNDMTDADLDAMQARCDAAPEGPWAVGMRNGFRYWETEEGLDLLWYTNDDDGIHARFGVDAFIAHARTDVPRLIAEVRRLKAQIDTLARSMT